jgi:hypothetical protein
MSDQPGIPAITVFPPFNPAPRREEPAPEATRAQTPPPAAEHAPEPAAEPNSAPVWDAAAATPAPMPWDFEAPAPQPDAAPEPNAGELQIGDEDDDLPWLEVPTARDADAAQELHAEDTPNFMDWVRTEDQPPQAESAEDAGETDDDGVPPIGDFAVDAQPWAPEVETAADEWAPESPAEPWKAPESATDDAWKAPQVDVADAWRAPASDDDTAEQPWDAPAQPDSAPWDAPADMDVPEPELYDLPDVPPAQPSAARPWTDAEAPLFEAPADAAEPEPAWELPADAAAGSDTSPAWESFAADDSANARWAAPEAGMEPTPAAQPAAASAPSADVSAAFGEVADRLQTIANALRSDPAGFMAGQGSDPLGLLVTGFVLGFQARRSGNG